MTKKLIQVAAKMNILFTKAQAAGNDFIIVDNTARSLSGKIDDLSRFAKFVCRRKYSIGADGLLVLEDSAEFDFRMRIFNPDGSEVAMCGNGIRVSALYAQNMKWCGDSMKIETAAGLLRASVNGEAVKVKMVPPENIELNRNIGAGNTVMNVHALNTGVPHAVHFVDNVEKYPVTEMGAKVRYHKVFRPEGTNADFVQVCGKSTIKVRTYERGVEDETLACGTGVVASAIVSHLVNGMQAPVKAVTKSGDVLVVYFKKGHDAFSDVYLEGEAHIVFNGGVDYV